MQARRTERQHGRKGATGTQPTHEGHIGTDGSTVQQNTEQNNGTSIIKYQSEDFHRRDVVVWCRVCLSVRLSVSKTTRAPTLTCFKGGGTKGMLRSAAALPTHRSPLPAHSRISLPYPPHFCSLPVVGVVRVQLCRDIGKSTRVDDGGGEGGGRERETFMPRASAPRSSPGPWCRRRPRRERRLARPQARPRRRSRGSVWG